MYTENVSVCAMCINSGNVIYLNRKHIIHTLSKPFSNLIITYDYALDQ